MLVMRGDWRVKSRSGEVILELYLVLVQLIGHRIIEWV